MGIELAAPWQPQGMSFVPCVRTSNLLFVSGHGPRKADGTFVNGKLGQDLDWKEGYEAARLVALDLLATIKGEIGDLDKGKRIVKLLGMVNSAPHFTRQPLVINGASDLLIAVFGYERGSHARSAVGMAALPTNIAVEIEMIVELEAEPTSSA